MLAAGLCQGQDSRTLDLTCYGCSHVALVGTTWLLEVFPRAFLWRGFLGHAPRRGGTKADTINPNGSKVQAVKQVRDISSCQLKLLYVSHKYFQTYVYSMNHYSGA